MLIRFETRAGSGKIEIRDLGNKIKQRNLEEMKSLI